MGKQHLLTLHFFEAAHRLHNKVSWDTIFPSLLVFSGKHKTLKEQEE